MALSVDRAVGVGGLVLTLIGSGIAVIWPDKRLGWFFIAAGLLIFLFAVVWVVARWHARKEFDREHEEPASRRSPTQTQSTEVAHGGIYVNVGTISQNAEQRLSAAEQSQQYDLQSIVIKPGLSSIESTKLDRYSGEVANLYRSVSDDPNANLVDCEVVFAKFRRADESPLEWINAKANIEFYNSKGELLYRVDRAYW